MPKISIIVPVYNVDKYLRQCLDSLLNQTLKDIEIICINDGSTDNCLQILEEYAKKDIRIKVISQRNKGLSGARNTGIEYINSQYTCFVDSDDYIEHNLCEQVLHIFENNNIDYICFGSEPFKDDNNLVQNFDSMQEYLRIKYYGIKEAKFEIGLNQNIHVWNKAFKTSIIKQYDIKFIESLLYEDIYFTWYYFFLSKKIYFEPKILHHYRMHSKSIMEMATSNKSFESAIHHLYNWHELMLSISKDKNLFKINIKNLKVLLKSYRRRTAQMCPVEDQKRVKQIAKQYNKELNKLIISKLGIVYYICIKLGLTNKKCK